MSEGDFFDIIEDDIEAGWAYIKAKAIQFYNAVSPLWAVPLKAFESGVVSQLWGAIVAFAQKLAGGGIRSLADLETAFLNTVSHLGGPLLAAAQTLGSQLLQMTLGFFHISQVQAAA